MKKILSFFCMICIISSIGTVNAQATEQTVYETEIETEAAVTTEGLISDYSLSISKSGNTLYINADTYAFSIMKKIGFTNIVVEYSTNNNNWYTYNDDFSPQTISNAYSYSLVNFPVPVETGYYYRVTLNHYAKEAGLFGSSQSVPNVSNVVW